jgi:hypothetical protein
MACGSCEKVIERTANRHGAKVMGISPATGLLVVECDDVNLSGLMKELSERGFPESQGVNGEGGMGAGREDERGNPARVIEYMAQVLAAAPGVEVEAGILRHSLATMVVFMAGAALFFAAGFGPALKVPEHMPIILLGFACSIMTVASYRHMSAYRKSMTCANGMMVGMTSGMVCGFLVGALIGATNGMFIGSVAGVAAGMAVGLMLGRYSGVMGAMEGLMSGLMSGTMGAMLSVMMVNDNLMMFIYALFGVSLIIIGGLSYMMHREAGPAPEKAGGTFAAFAFWSLALGITLAAMMLFGPKGPITYP